MNGVAKRERLLLILFCYRDSFSRSRVKTAKKNSLDQSSPFFSIKSPLNTPLFITISVNRSKLTEILQIEAIFKRVPNLFGRSGVTEECAMEFSSCFASAKSVSPSTVPPITISTTSGKFCCIDLFSHSFKTHVLTLLYFQTLL